MDVARNFFKRARMTGVLCSAASVVNDGNNACGNKNALPARDSGEAKAGGARLNGDHDHIHKDVEDVD